MHAVDFLNRLKPFNMTIINERKKNDAISKHEEENFTYRCTKVFSPRKACGDIELIWLFSMNLKKTLS